MVEELREQFVQDSDAFEREQEQHAKQPFLGLQPWQRCVLAFLLFLVVAVCGVMGLTMLGRIALPF